MKAQCVKLATHGLVLAALAVGASACGDSKPPPAPTTTPTQCTLQPKQCADGSYSVVNSSCENVCLDGSKP